MKPWHFKALIIACIILYNTNPHEEKHFQTISRYLKQQSAAYGQLVYALNEGIGWHSTILNALDLQYHNYKIFSYTTVGNASFPVLGTDGEIVSIGFLGHVTTPKIQIP